MIFMMTILAMLKKNKIKFEASTRCVSVCVCDAFQSFILKAL